MSAKRGRSTWRLTVTMRTLVPKDPHPGVDALRQRTRRRSDGDCDEIRRAGGRAGACGTGSSHRHWNVRRLCYADREARSTVPRRAEEGMGKEYVGRQA